MQSRLLKNKTIRRTDKTLRQIGFSLLKTLLFLVFVFLPMFNVNINLQNLLLTL